MNAIALKGPDFAGSADFDALLATLPETVVLHLTGSFKRKPVYRWGQFASRNCGSDWMIDGDAEISIDVDAISDAEIDGQPLYAFASRVGAPIVRGVTLIGNHSALAARWKAKGMSLRTGGLLLYGEAQIDTVTFKDFGALGAETFVAEIVGSGDIRNSVFTDHNPASSDNQVTVFRTIASENGESTSTVRSIHEHNTTNAPGSKLVQAHTIYGSPGLVQFNKSVGADVLYYGDYLKNSDVTIDQNDATDYIHIVQLKLSPTPLPQASGFSHERYIIGPQTKSGGRGRDVSLDTCGAPTATRFIRDIQVDPSLSLENVMYDGKGGATNVTWMRLAPVAAPAPASWWQRLLRFFHL